MIVFADVNTIWRAKLAEAMFERGETVLGVRPGTFLEARPSHLQGSKLPLLDIALPRGWASHLARPSQAYLAHRIRKRAKPGAALIVTVPQYLPLARYLHRDMPIFYYCSDDYRSYAGWDGERMRRLEGELLGLCTKAFFVSRALADRAITEYGTEPTRVEVSMNATEPRFLATNSDETPADVGHLPRPIVGVVGAINARLDFQLLLRAASLPKLGTLLLVGPVAPEAASDPLFQELRTQRRVILVGAQSHQNLHHWTKSLDVALIPYRTSPLNFFCSPMRLFDHLASDRPIVATAACDQCNSFTDHVLVGNTTALVLAHLHRLLSNKSQLIYVSNQSRSGWSHFWTDRAQHVISSIHEYHLDPRIL